MELGYTWALLVVGGFAAGFINAVAGAGSALTMPVLLLAGLDANVANGTNRLAVLAQAVGAVGTFHRRRVLPWSKLRAAAPLTLAGAIAGALLATWLSPKITQGAFGVVFVALAVVMVARPGWLGPPKHPAPGPPGWGGRAALILVGFYGGLFQVGVGIAFLLVFTRSLHLDLVRSNGLKVAVILMYTLVAVAVFQLTGNLHWPFGLALAASGLVGGAVGARVAVARGAPFVRRVVVGVLLLAAARFLWPSTLLG